MKLPTAFVTLLLVLTTFVFVIEQVHANVGMSYMFYTGVLPFFVSTFLFVVLVEGVALRVGFHLSWRYAFRVVIVVNLVSTFVGYFVLANLIDRFDWVFEVFADFEKSNPGLSMLAATLSLTLLNVTIETPLLPWQNVKLTQRGMIFFVLANLVSTFVILFLVMSE